MYRVWNTNFLNQNFGNLILLNTNSYNFNSSSISPKCWWNIYHFALHFGDLRYNTQNPKYSNMNFQDVTTGNNDSGEKRVCLVDYVTYHCYPGRCMCRVEQGVSQSVTHCDWVGCILSPQNDFLSQICCICWRWAASSFVSPRCLVTLTSADWSVQFREI
jgi:hypothetical protein